MAKGRGGGGGSGSGIDDNWDAPPETKAAMAFEIIWFILSLLQLYYIGKNLKQIPPMAARGPYIMLAVVTFCFGLYNLLAAIATRADSISFSSSNSLFCALVFFGNVDSAFRPAVVLYLIHVRGDVLRGLKGTSPLSTQIWKRILDWVLTGLAWVMFTASLGITGTELASFASGNYDYDQIDALAKASMGVGQTGTAFVILLIINVVVSVIVQHIQGKGLPTSDLVTRRLLILAVPLFLILAIEVLFFDIYTLVGPLDYDRLAVNLASIIVNGLVEVSITAVIILTMTLPGVQWTAQAVVPEIAAAPGKQWGAPNPGWNQQPYPPNAGWNQSGYSPQQPPQQSQFYPAPHPMFQQMQQQQHIYSPPVQPMPNQTAQYSPPTHPPPNQA